MMLDKRIVVGMGERRKLNLEWKRMILLYRCGGFKCGGQGGRTVAFEFFHLIWHDPIGICFISIVFYN